MSSRSTTGSKCCGTIAANGIAIRSTRRTFPAVGDLDGDGRDEVNGGHFGLDHDGSVLWETFLGDHADSVLVDRWGTEPAAIVSGGGQVLDGSGRRLLHLGADVVPHGQEVRYGNLRPELPGRELAIRYNGHHADVMIVAHSGAGTQPLPSG